MDKQKNDKKVKEFPIELTMSLQYLPPCENIIIGKLVIGIEVRYWHLMTRTSQENFNYNNNISRMFYTDSLNTSIILDKIKSHNGNETYSVFVYFTGAVWPSSKTIQWYVGTLRCIEYYEAIMESQEETKIA